MTPTIRTPKPASWVPSLGCLVLLAALAAGPVGAGAAERPAMSPPGVTEIRQVADRALDRYVRPGAITGVRAEASEVVTATEPAPTAEKIVREFARPSVLSDAHAAVVAVPGKATGPSFVADTHAAATEVLTDTQTRAANALRTLVPGAN